MLPEKKHLETLRIILDNSSHPEVLNSHPWTKSLIVLESVRKDSALNNVTPGLQLLVTITKFFTAMMPDSAPRRGQPIDVRWGEFGVLAAQYFAPLIFGSPAPASLGDTWKYVNQGILSFVLDRARISQDEIANYELMGRTLAAANGMINHWGQKGLERLAEKIITRENLLSNTLGIPAVIIDSEANFRNRINTPQKIGTNTLKTISGRQLALPLTAVFIMFLLIVSLFGGIEIYRVYNLASVVGGDAAYIQKIIEEPAPRVDKFENSFLAFSKLKKDFTAFKNEARLFLWMGPFLKWVPVYGDDLAAMNDLTILADAMITSADMSFLAFAPLVGESGNLFLATPTELIKFLKDNQNQIASAQEAFIQAETARDRLEIDSLSPEMRNLVLNKIDPLMGLMKNGLTMAVELPRIMGATDEGPKTYLLLVQNEDELRPTGGFITAASIIRMQNGGISDLNFVNSGDLDNWGELYPAPPWQLSEYMNSQVFLLRDSNWFTNYPTAAAYARYLYSYTNQNPVDGVIAFDQHFLVEILNVTGPITLESAPYTIDAGNIVQYMRASKVRSEQNANSLDWNNKAFLNKIAYALINKIFSGDVQWELISTELLRALSERHLLLQLDNPAMTDLLAHNHWDGAVRPKTGDDFLMVVDTNIGFNKTNAVVESSLVYDVDFTNPSSPTSTLTVIHKNNAAQGVSCKQWNKLRLDNEEEYPITDCYWNYLRIYTPKENRLISAMPQSVPEDWMMLKQQRTGRVDILNEYEEDINGVQGFGTLQVVPNNSSLAVSFVFALPSNIIKTNLAGMVYDLKVQKQPGTLAVPISIHVRFANNVSINSAPPGSLTQGYDVLYETNLRNDLEFKIIFSN